VRSKSRMTAEATATDNPTAKGTLDQVGQQAREVRSQTSAAADIAHEAQARSAHSLAV
jgi:hypothetical protein